MMTALDRHITGNYGEDQHTDGPTDGPESTITGYWPEALGFLPLHADGVPGCAYTGWAVHGDYTTFADGSSCFETDCPACGYRMTGRQL